MSLVSTEWLQKNLNNVKIIDSSWHLPNTKRNGYKEYLKNQRKNSLFFDIDTCSKKNTDLPHMLVDISEWEKIVSDMGIENSDEIVIYDNSDLVSSCRCWYNFLYFGHNPKFVKILNGGFKKWHYEKGDAFNFSRNLVFMTYLNDIENGGTHFKYQNLTSPAKKGLTLIWPPDWTHTHKGQIVDKEKFIATGWYRLI